MTGLATKVPLLRGIVAEDRERKVVVDPEARWARWKLPLKPLNALFERAQAHTPRAKSLGNQSGSRIPRPGTSGASAGALRGTCVPPPSQSERRVASTGPEVPSARGYRVRGEVER